MKDSIAGRHAAFVILAAAALAPHKAPHPVRTVTDDPTTDDTPPVPPAPDPMKEAHSRAERRRIEKAEAKRRRKLEKIAKQVSRGGRDG